MMRIHKLQLETSCDSSSRTVKQSVLITARTTLALMACVFSTQSFAVDVVLDRIVAVVNEGVVLDSELTAESRFVKQQAKSNRQSLPADGVLRERVLQRLIDQEIQRQHAAKLGIAVDASGINRAVEQVARSNNMDSIQFRETMQNQGFDYNRFRANIGKELLLSRLIQRDVEARIRVNKQEIDDFLFTANNNEENFRYRIQHILIAVPSSAPQSDVEKAETRATNVLRKLRNGADFAQVAAAESDGTRALEGGDLGWRELQEVPDFLADALRTMAAGDINGPLRSQNGFHLVRLADKDDGKTQTTAETLVRHIFVTGGTSENVEGKLARVRQRIIAGESFASLAAEVSEDPNSANAGGELPWFASGQMPAELEQAANGLKANTISQPFRTQFGWHILEVLDRRTREASDDLVRQQAEQSLRQRKVEQETERWIRQLRDESFIQIRS